MEDELYEAWAKRNPRYLKRFEKIIDSFCVRRQSAINASSGKIFGAGYELYILAFFIGLYRDERVSLSKGEIEEGTEVFGHPIKYWGDISEKSRKQYPKIREYIYMALIAKTQDLQLIELAQGKSDVQIEAKKLIVTMEEYANAGFRFIKDKIEEVPQWGTRQEDFLKLFLELAHTEDPVKKNGPEPL